MEHSGSGAWSAEVYKAMQASAVRLWPVVKLGEAMQSSRVWCKSGAGTADSTPEKITWSG